VARRTFLRASDADREAVAERLRHATVEGRLVAEELEERLEAAFAARTYGELDAVVADLPVPRPQRRHQPARRQPAFAHWILPVLVMAIVFPIVVAAVVAVAVFLLTGMFTVWVVWLALAWFFFGHRRRIYARRPPHWSRF
jgi:Flp pilus assembly protein TadB